MLEVSAGTVGLWFLGDSITRDVVGAAVLSRSDVFWLDRDGAKGGSAGRGRIFDFFESPDTALADIVLPLFGVIGASGFVGAEADDPEEADLGPTLLWAETGLDAAARMTAEPLATLPPAPGEDFACFTETDDAFGFGTGLTAIFLATAADAFVAGLRVATGLGAFFFATTGATFLPLIFPVGAALAAVLSLEGSTLITAGFAFATAPFTLEETTFLPLIFPVGAALAAAFSLEGSTLATAGFAFATARFTWEETTFAVEVGSAFFTDFTTGFAACRTDFACPFAA